MNLKELTLEETKGLKFLGSGCGINLGHCVFMGTRHCENFKNRVYGYRVIEKDKVTQMIEKSLKEVLNKESEGGYITVEFYEK